MKGVELTKILNYHVVRFQAAEKSLSEQASVVPQYQGQAERPGLLPSCHLRRHSGGLQGGQVQAAADGLQGDARRLPFLRARPIHQL